MCVHVHLHAYIHAYMHTYIHIVRVSGTVDLELQKLMFMFMFVLMLVLVFMFMFMFMLIFGCVLPYSAGERVYVLGAWFVYSCMENVFLKRWGLAGATSMR